MLTVEAPPVERGLTQPAAGYEGGRTLPPAFPDAPGFGQAEDFDDRFKANASFGPATAPAEPPATRPAGAPPEVTHNEIPGERPSAAETLAPTAAEQVADTDGTAPATAAPTAPAAKAPEFSPDLIELASLEGLDTKEFKSAEELQRTLKILDAKRIEFGTGLLSQPQLPVAPQQFVPQASPQVVPQSQPQAPAPIDDATIAAGLKKIEEYGGNELVEAMKPFFNGLRFAQQQAQAARQQFTDFQQRQLVDQIDQSFAALGEQFAPFIGTGTIAEIPAVSDFKRARDQIFDHAVAMQATYERQGKKVPLTALVKRAAYGLFGDKLTAAATDKGAQAVKDRLRNRQGQFISPPTHQKPLSGAQVNPIHAAQSAVGQKLAEFGVREG